VRNVLFLAMSVVAWLIAGAAGAQTLGQNEGRLLASNCTQCHGTNGQPRVGGIESLAGKSYSKIKSEMAELARKSPASEPDEEIMIVHAKAYTPAEIDAIAHYLSGQ
jgi:cytochrome subunit of sulfide dehydrogenase